MFFCFPCFVFSDPITSKVCRVLKQAHTETTPGEDFSLISPEPCFSPARYSFYSTSSFFYTYFLTYHACDEDYYIDNPSHLPLSMVRYLSLLPFVS